MPTYPQSNGQCHPDGIYADDFERLVMESVEEVAYHSREYLETLAPLVAELFLAKLCDATEGRLLVALSEDETREYAGEGEQMTTQYKMTPTPEREWTYMNRSGWSSGAWDNEPDKRQWTDNATGLPCLIVRGPLGALCGYVGVPESHPWFGKQTDDCTLPSAKPAGSDPKDKYYSTDPQSWYQLYTASKLVCNEGALCRHQPVADVHGGLTFSGTCSPHTDNPEHGIGRVVESNEKVWWFGFDCSHLYDLTPVRWQAEYGSSYKSIRYVESEVTILAAQLVNLGTFDVE